MRAKSRPCSTSSALALPAGHLAVLAIARVQAELPVRTSSCPGLGPGAGLGQRGVERLAQLRLHGRGVVASLLVASVSTSQSCTTSVLPVADNCSTFCGGCAVEF